MEILTSENHYDQIIEIRNIIELCLSYKIDELLREDLGEELNFKVLENNLKFIHNLLGNVKDENLNKVLLTDLKKISQYINVYNKVYFDIKNFDISKPNPKELHDQIINRVIAFSNGMYHYFMPVFNIDILENNDLLFTKAEIEKRMQSFNLEIFDATKNVRIQEEELKKIIQDLKSEATLIKYSGKFEQLANKNKISARWWLASSIFFIVLVISATIISFFLFSDFKENLVYFTVSKVVVISVLFIGLSFSIKNYKAQKHNQILNLHKQSSLTTFETFSEASHANAQTKNAVLLETTHTIFSNPQTGYIKTSSDGDSQNNIFEIIKSLLSQYK